MFMRYLGGGIGHQNQDKRWTPRVEESPQNNAMVVDPTPAAGVHAENSAASRGNIELQKLQILALETSNHPAGSDDEDIDSGESDDSEGSREGYASDDDSDEEVDEYEPYFGPEDGEGNEEDTGFADF